MKNKMGTWRHFLKKQNNAADETATTKRQYLVKTVNGASYLERQYLKDLGALEYDLQNLEQQHEDRATQFKSN